MIKALLFDFDGVIADSEPLHYEAERKLIERHGKKFNEVAFSQTLGRSIKDAIEIYKSFFEIDAPTNKLLREHDDIFIKLVEKKLKPVPGALDLIRRIAISDYQFSIASSGTLSYIKIALKKFGITDLFGDRITSIEMVKKGKPEPDLFLHAAKRLHVAPRYCLVIEDSTSGIKAAHKAGMYSLFLSKTSKFDENAYNSKRVQSLNEINKKLLNEFV